ncbi:hypothetical protein SLOPH_1215, partial [Spraguea lophii 42_110]
MGESSDEQIFSQRRQQFKKDEEEISEEDYYDDGYMDNIILDVFGTGKEYNYIYENIRNEDSDTDSSHSIKYETNKQIDKNININSCINPHINLVPTQRLDVEECAEWISRIINIQYEDIRIVVRSLDKGVSPYHIALHQKENNLKIMEILETQDYMNNFKKYKNIKEQILAYDFMQLNNKKEIDNNNLLEDIEKTYKLEEIIEYKKYLNKLNNLKDNRIHSLIEGIYKIIKNGDSEYIEESKYKIDNKVNVDVIIDILLSYPLFLEYLYNIYDICINI